MRTASYGIAIVFGGLLLIVGMSGCQYAYRFEISGVVNDAANGTSLAGVSVMLKSGGHTVTPFPVITGPDGKYHASFKVRDGDFMRDKLPEWSLVFSKDGYEDETLDVSPKKRPASLSTTTQISVDGQLRAK